MGAYQCDHTQINRRKGTQFLGIFICMGIHRKVKLRESFSLYSSYQSKEGVGFKGQ